ncbi:MRC1-like domain-containing protein [Amylocarpus encephaloides]|uniref:MRC1-like domain-containing protein n=1 Tax=Amylocarpus encephaloides TaxID=45428 RepID=A0A9P7YK37_9HELO|nr:MRC1-like domain-containing protein [Amylocarpus encephaloides]
MMSSTRGSSPEIDSSPPSPSQLTPRSKVRAALAQFDNDSDDDSVKHSARTRVKAGLATSTPSKSTAPPQKTQSFEEAVSNAVATSNDGDSTDEEEEDVVRPRGRMAALMMANEHSSEDDIQTTTSSQMAGKKTSPPNSRSPESTTDETAISSDESDMPVVSRKRKLRIVSRETPKSSPAKSVGSPGLFVSPSADQTAMNAGDDSDSDLPAPSADRFKALVQKKREERQAREAEAAEEKARQLAERRKTQARDIEEDDDDMSDGGERRLTQPTRKASKRAQEEIRRETQRMSRNQQLAHNAITKKKYFKADLLAKFNFGPKKDPSDPIEAMNSSSPAPQSDVEMKETPPTSPATPSREIDKSFEALVAPLEESQVKDLDEELPTLEDASSQIQSSPPRMDKGKGRAVDEIVPQPELPQKKQMFTQRLIRIRAPKIMKTTAALEDSDSDLEIIPTKTPNRQRRKMDAIFDRIPAKQAKESHSIHALRMLALVKSPRKQSNGKSKKPGMTTGELQVSLQQKARQQATREREERLQALREKGVIVQTAEEREKELAEVEDLISKARREADEIMLREKAAAKKERQANGEIDPLGDSSDDEDWEESKVPLPELSASGSDEELDAELDDSEGDASGEDEEDEDPNEEETVAANPLFDDEAGESDVDEDEIDVTIPEETLGDDDVEEEGIPIMPANPSKRRSRNIIISDDEDLEDEDVEESFSVPQTQSPMQFHNDSPAVPNSVLRSATKTFIPGVTVAGPAGLGLTQIFAGTMDDSQFEAEVDFPSQVAPKEKLAFLRNIPAPALPDFVPTMAEDTQLHDTVMESQPSQDIDSQDFDSIPSMISLHYSQSQVHGFDSLVENSQMSPFPDATQDLGYLNTTPIRGRFSEEPPSTVDTIMLDPSALPETTMETPIAKKKGKLRRRNRATSFSDEENNVAPLERVTEEDEFDVTSNAFDMMRKASKKKKKAVVDEFDKKNSKAKEMVQEQADESEDEYAGLGGASDDDSGNEDDTLVKEMIDDEGGMIVDERQIAAFFADRERATDEKVVEKLYKDITNGMLRRKRGADYDLSDSDDGGEARKRRKRAEFAKMRKALLSDERIGKIAENPKRQAFLRAIEDRGSGDEIDFLDDFAEVEGADSQSQTQGEDIQQVVPDSQPIEMGPPTRNPSDTTDPPTRPPPHLRRTKPAKKPANLSEIRESLSSLIEEPNSLVQTVDLGSDSENELEFEGQPSKEGGQEKENRDPFALRRTKGHVIDRISLKRQSSSTLSASTRLAFTASSAASTFKVPALLRKATTNSSLTSTTSSIGGTTSATERTAGGSGSDGVKRGGGKNSGVNFFARETERRAAVVKTEQRRERKRFKGAEGRRKVVGGLFGGGKFE